MNVVQFPSYPSHKTFIAYYPEVSPQTLHTVKSQLIQRNSEYDYCFLSTTHVVSLEQLYCAIHKAIQNLVNGEMKANSLNAEIILSLSPVNNINDSLKRFGIDESRDDLVVVCVADQQTDFAALESVLSRLLGSASSELCDSILFSRFDEKKFKKLFKLQDVPSDQALYTKGAIAASLLRGL